MSLFLDFFNTQKSRKSFATFVSIILPCSKFSNIPISEKIHFRKRKETKFPRYFYSEKKNTASIYITIDSTVLCILMPPTSLKVF